MNLQDQYSKELSLVNGNPDFNKSRAIKRFLLLKDFEDNFFSSLKQRSDRKISQTKALKEYSKLRKISYHTLLRWHTDYYRYGIMGLLPKYRGLGIRSVILKRRKIQATIMIDKRAPLACLEKIRTIIEKCQSIAPDVREISLSALDRYFNSLIYSNPLTLTEPLSPDEIKALNRYKAGNHKKYCRKAMGILMANDGRTLMEIRDATHVAKRTVYRWLSRFNRERLESIKVRINAPNKEKEKVLRQTRVIDIIHKLPSLYGINRATWTYRAIAVAYAKEYGIPISVDKIKAVINSTGYSWRRARVVLTSPDPDYKAKVERILDTLHGLKEGERFFFIDEVGPYRVKKYGGVRLSLKEQIETVPALQKGRGKVQFVAALEAMTNQLSWRFTADKSAISMVSFIDMLVTAYADSPAIYLTWDAISVHHAKAVTEWMKAHNEAGKGPRIEIVPLPSKAQFLNVIEAVFGGMKKAVICNSDYATPLEMQQAIARHFEERNQFYRDNPKRAGNKIWDKQAFDVDRLIGGLFRKM